MNIIDLLPELKTTLVANRHRQLIVLCGEPEWAWQQVNDILTNYQSPIILSSSHQQGIWPEHNHQLLGQEFDCGIYDYHSGLLPDKLATLSGTIKTGGVLVIVAPQREALQALRDDGFQRFQSAGLAPSPFSVFNCYFNAQLDQLPLLLLEKNTIKKGSLEPIETKNDKLTQDEVVKRFSEKVMKLQNVPLLITADRGRGKSAALGMIANKLVAQGLNVIISASQQKAVQSAFNHFCYEQGLTFFAPDALLTQKPVCDVLLIDEAATLPIPLLKQLLAHYPKIIFATTMHGYEGTGRGFTLRFIPYLASGFKHFEQAHLTQPIRFNQGDPLEYSINRLLLLDADFKDVTNITSDKITHQEISASALLKQPQLLRQVFSLLVLAHYQTTANDLRHLLDGNNLKLFISQHHEQLIAVNLVAIEGGFEPELARQIIQGKRRPKGHLLAQSIAHQSGNQADLYQHYARVIRIAVHPQIQGCDVGTRLLQFMEAKLARQVTGFGTSFGAQHNLIKFWHKNHYQLIKLGFKRDKASAEHSALMVKSANNPWLQTLKTHFFTQMEMQLQRTFQQLDGNLIVWCLDSQQPFKSSLDKEVIARYIRGEAAFEQAYSALYRNLLITPSALKKLEKVSRCLLIKLVLQGQSFSIVQESLRINGKKQLQQHLKLATQQWLDSLC